MKKLKNFWAILMDNCPAGGDHTSGTSGEWVGKCTKCGSPC